MPWQGVAQHDRLVEAFRHCARQGRIANAYLFVGEAGIGKRTFANKLVQAMLCDKHEESDLESCETCPSCQQVLAGSHPDVIVVEKASDENFIPIESFIGDREHRNQAGLCHDIGLKPYSGRRKFAIIDDADFLNVEGANSLLKTLEEPPAGSVIILISTNDHLQLPTIRSRCQIVRFTALPETTVAELLGTASRDVDVDDVAAGSNGSLAMAHWLLDESLGPFREWLLQRLSATGFDPVELGRHSIEFVEEVGQDSFARRARVREVLAMASEFYRQVMRQVSQASTRGDQAMNEAIERCQDWTAAQASNCIDACLDAREQIDANANLTALMLWWAEELGQARRR